MAGVVGSQPGSLAKPVPGQEVDEELDTQLLEILQGSKGMQKAAAPMEGEQPEQPMSEPMMAEEVQPASAQVSLTAEEDAALLSTLGVEPQENLSEYSGARDLGDNLSEMFTRFKFKMAQSDEARKQVLEKSFGPENVRKEKDEWWVKPKEGGKFIRVDSDQFDIFSDIFVDNAREIVEGAGVAVGAFTGGLGGAVVGGIATKNAVDALGESLGVPSTTRLYMEGKASGFDLAFEQSVGPALDIALAGLGKVASAYKESIKSGAKKMVSAVEKNLLMTQGKERLESLEKKAFEEGIIGKDKMFYETLNTPEELLPDNPEILRIAKEARNSVEYQAYHKNRQEVVTEALKDFIGVVDEPDLATGSAEAFFKKPGEILKMEGEVLGKLRALASDKPAKGTVDNFNTALEKWAAERSEYFKIIEPKVEKAVGIQMRPGKRKIALNEKGLLSIGMKKNQITALQKSIDDIAMAAKNGEVDLNVMKQAIDRMGDTLDQMGIGDNTTKAIFSNLKGAMVEDYAELIGKNLRDPRSAALYNATRKRYSEVKEAVKTFGNFLRKDPTSDEVVANYIFNGSKGDTLRRIRAFKTLTKHDPELWESVRTQYVFDTFEKHAGNPAKVLKEMKTKLGSSGWAEVYGNDPKRTYENMKVFYEVSKTLKEPLSVVPEESLREAAEKGVTALMANASYALANRVIGLIKRADGPGKHYEKLFLDPTRMKKIIDKYKVQDRPAMERAVIKIQEGLINLADPKSPADILNRTMFEASEDWLTDQGR